MSGVSLINGTVITETVGTLCKKFSYELQNRRDSFPSFYYEDDLHG